jgi:hypothetical protein
MHLGQDGRDLERQSEEGIEVEPLCGEQHGQRHPTAIFEYQAPSLIGA